jgi:hypothetical protein
LDVRRNLANDLSEPKADFFLAMHGLIEGVSRNDYYATTLNYKADKSRQNGSKSILEKPAAVIQ